MMNYKTIGLWLGILLFGIVFLVPFPDGLSPQARNTAAVAVLMITWWISEAIPIYMTAFLPIVLFPFFGIMNSVETTRNYGHDYVLMLLGAFMLAKGIEKQGVHKRMSLVTISVLGSGKRAIILGFMIATAFLSMWITNMAVVLIMLPVAMAIVKKERPDTQKSFGLALLLGIAYAASIGGTGTLIGTPPNMVFAGLLNKMYPGAPEIDFLGWMKIGFPIVLLCVPIVWIYLLLFFKISGTLDGGNELIAKEKSRLGKASVGEKRTLLIFLLTGFGWIFKSQLRLGSFTLPGWSDLLGISDYVHDSTVAVLGAILLFVVNDGNNQKLLDWKSARTVPWGVAMFLGGGLALGAAFKGSGLANWIGNSFTILQTLPDFLVVLLVVALIIFITEVNSNTATATIFLPILAAIAVAGSIHPLFLMIPATFACSFAFMLPSGTGTNTVIFASEQMTIQEMAKTGFWLNLLFVLLLPLLFYLVILPMMGIDLSVPEWAS